MDETIKNALEIFDRDSPKVAVRQALSTYTGGPEALLQLVLAFNAWMPTRTYMTGDVAKASLWVKRGYPEAVGLSSLDENDLEKDSILIIPEIHGCPKNLIEKGVKVYVYQLGKAPTEENLNAGCGYISHNFWLSENFGLDLPRSHILTPYLTKMKSNFAPIANDGREDIILVNHDSFGRIPLLESFCQKREQPCSVTKLQGFNEDGLNSIYRKAKIIYAQCMRGSERSVLEAALGGMLILADDCDNSKDTRDFPLPRDHLVTGRNTWEDVATKMFDNFEEEQEKLDGLRYHYKHLGHESLLKETKNFVYAVTKNR